MKAIVVRETAGPDQVKCEEVDQPVPKAGEVLIKLKYAALNRRDVFITRGMYPGMNLPAVLGSDGAGEIAALGEGVSGWGEGSPVIIHPAVDWGDHQAAHGSNHRVLGMPDDGTFAEYIAVPAENVHPKPEYLSWEEAAAFPLAGVTAYRALMYRGNLKPGENVLIPGIGSGVALVALQIAAAHGANVYVTSSSEEKLKKAKAFGAKGGVNYREENWAKDLKQAMGGADLIIDGVGGDNFNNLIYLANPAARIVSFGATAGPVKELVMPRVFFKQLDIKGSTMGSPEDFKQMLAFFEKHQITPHVDRNFPLEKAQEALKYMEEGTNFGKITLKIGE